MSPRTRRNLHKIVDAIEARDGAALVDNLTARTPTFTARDLDQALKYGVLTKDERAEFRGQILANPNVIGLKETADAKVTRYTTRDVLASEMGLQRSAQNLADDSSHGLKESRVEKTAAAFTLKPEQAKALAQLTSAEGFGVLWGEAGTGKSHTLKAVRSAYEGEGYDVRGLAPTHKVKNQMHGDGFKNANTIASELKGIEEGRSTWNKKTVVVVDEAAMVSTDQLAKLAGAAHKAGAKLIIAGDDAQLGSIERGGMFETLRQKHGAAILEEVQRIDDLEERKLWGKMHKGEFREMLAKHDAAGNIHWAEKQADAMRDMAQAYTAATAATPDKTRFMFAFTNAEVGALNAHAREVHKGRGELGEDCTLKTAHGEATFATGDRIQFAGNGYGKKAINAGLSNGQVGTIMEIASEGDKPRITVMLDTAAGEKPHEVSFVVGSNGKAGEFDNFKLGYAGTIYRGQGNTLDQAFVCHSSQWRGSAAYVALTRHREDVQIFAAHETVADIEAMARGMARPENKRAATAYQIDPAQLFALEAAVVTEVRPAPPIHDTAPAEAYAVTPDYAVEVSFGDVSAPEQEAAPASEQTPAAEISVESVVSSAEAGLGVVLDGAANIATKAIDTFADFFGGGSAAPKAPPRVMTAKEQHEAKIKAFVAADREQATKNLQEIARSLGISATMSPEELQREKDEQAQRSRDRGGGISR